MLPKFQIPKGAYFTPLWICSSFHPEPYLADLPTFVLNNRRTKYSCSGH